MCGKKIAEVESRDFAVGGFDGCRTVLSDCERKLKRKGKGGKHLMNSSESIRKMKKRDGRIVDFDPQRIAIAAGKALKAAGMGSDKVARHIADDVVRELIDKGYDEELMIPDVEVIQDLVEHAFVKRGLSQAAKLYILYRANHAKIREAKKLMMDVQELVSSYLGQEDWRVNENSNSGYSYASLLNHVSGSVIANYALANMYPPEIAEAHTKRFAIVLLDGHGDFRPVDGRGRREKETRQVVVRQQSEAFARLGKTPVVGRFACFIRTRALLRKGQKIRMTTDQGRPVDVRRIGIEFLDKAHGRRRAAAVERDDAGEKREILGEELAVEVPFKGRRRRHGNSSPLRWTRHSRPPSRAFSAALGAPFSALVRRYRTTAPPSAPSPTIRAPSAP